MSGFSHLSHRERAARYRALAREARLKAAQCTGEMQASFIKFAGQWEQLAREADNDAEAEK